MKIFQCKCGSSLFFNSLSCVSCSAVTARCPNCHKITALDAVTTADSEGMLFSSTSLGRLALTDYQCNGCKCKVKLCQNRIQYHACNAAVYADAANSFCRYCDLNVLVPDLSFPDHLTKWQRVEAAKHRVLYDCERIGLPVGDEPNVVPKLRFQFKSSLAEPVVTGHASGLITIDTEEADSVTREKIRVHFGEPQRTLIGHFRHELGHYYWECLVLPHRLTDFRFVFGNELQPSYADALQNYYSQLSMPGRPQQWQLNFVSQYASMHPWEDFAECFNTYLDMVAIAANAVSAPLTLQHPDYSFQSLLDTYIKIGIFANELNRDIGLPDLVPEVFTSVVVEKLRFIHELVCVAPELVDAPKCD